MNPARALEWLAAEPSFRERLGHVETFEPREPEYAEPVHELKSELRARLDALGMRRLYVHQAAAYDAAMEGKNLAVVTGTASGKTLCYNLPVLERLLDEPNARAFYLFPTKALAQDQLGKLEELTAGLEVRCGAYDGDTPKAQRGAVRKGAHIVLTNPDMLHVGILPNHESWDKFLASLRFVVVDEMHAYRGVFGSHVACILRRLLRLAEWYGSRPQVIACSATIANPGELFKKLTGRPAEVIDRDGAPRGRRAVALVGQPSAEEAAERSPNRETGALLAEFSRHGVRSLAFCRARISAELVLRSARKRLEGSGGDPGLVESYRGGYTPKERRAIEQALFHGRLMGLATTNAMELGVDVGGLDAVVLNGFPGSIASFWQQVGRAGRGGREGVAVMIAHADPLEQFLVREPGLLFDRPVESVAINPGNRFVLSAQLRCAAFERAISQAEVSSFGPGALDVAESLVDAGDLEFKVVPSLRGEVGMFFYISHDKPAPKVNIRGTEGPTVILYVGGEQLGEMERWRAFRNAHAGAVYLHRGQTYTVQDLDLARWEAHLTEGDVDHFTQPIVQAVLEPTVPIDAVRFEPYSASLMGLKVTTLVAAFRKMALDASTQLSEELLDLPPETYDSVGVRLELPAELATSEDPAVFGGVHAVEHALMAVAPLLAGCDRGDIESSWYSFCPDTLSPAVYVYDATPGGVGLAETLYERRGEWLEAALHLLTTCPCQDGCPSCTLSPRCESANGLLDKPSAVRLLESMVAAHKATGDPGAGAGRG